MTLNERLTEEYKNALRNHDEVRKRTISSARAAVKHVEVDERKELSDDDIAVILTKQVKMRKDALPDFERAGRTDLLDAYRAEIDVLSEFLPKQLSEEEIKDVIRKAAAGLGIEGGKENMGKLMGAVMKELKGKADGNTVRKNVEEFLS
ncbi:MAG: GatB/YqeY domain-containing protein [Anaerovoracaceae bacterium]|nr:GatB/YqeY domain-containing protein [Anaerovoracaceae bacterium]